MAEEAEGAQVVEVALAAALGNGEDVVGVPQAAAAGDGLHAVEAETGGSRCSSGAFQDVVSGYGVDAAGGAASAIAYEDLIAEVAGVGAHSPLVDAVVGAEGAAAFCDDLEIAPAAEREAVGSGRESVAGGAATGKCARNKHALLA